MICGTCVILLFGVLYFVLLCFGYVVLVVVVIQDLFFFENIFCRPKYYVKDVFGLLIVLRGCRALVMMGVVLLVLPGRTLRLILSC